MRSRQGNKARVTHLVPRPIHREYLQEASVRCSAFQWEPATTNHPLNINHLNQKKACQYGSRITNTTIPLIPPPCPTSTAKAIPYKVLPSSSPSAKPTTKMSPASSPRSLPSCLPYPPPAALNPPQAPPPRPARLHRQTHQLLLHIHIHTSRLQCVPMAKARTRRVRSSKWQTRASPELVEGFDEGHPAGRAVPSRSHTLPRLASPPSCDLLLLPARGKGSPVLPINVHLRTYVQSSLKEKRGPYFREKWRHTLWIA